MLKKLDMQKTNKFLLVFPYIIITLLFVVIPLILILIKSFSPATDSVTGEKLPVSDNWSFIGSTIFQKIGLSIGIAISTTLACFIIGYLFAYFLSLTKNVSLKILAISLITSPIWMSMLIKLVGLKTLFDFINGAPNSTYGSIFTIIALTYINLPLFILTIYTYINSIPKNLLQASKDLGKTSVQTFFYVIIPYTKTAIISGLTLVFLPSITTAGVTQFVNNSNDGTIIGGDILDQGLEASTSEIALARVSSLALTTCLIILLLWSAIVLIPKTIKMIKQKRIGNKDV